MKPFHLTILATIVGLGTIAKSHIVGAWGVVAKLLIVTKMPTAENTKSVLDAAKLEFDKFFAGTTTDAADKIEVLEHVSTSVKDSIDVADMTTAIFFKGLLDGGRDQIALSAPNDMGQLVETTEVTRLLAERIAYIERHGDAPTMHAIDGDHAADAAAPQLANDAEQEQRTGTGG